MFTLHISKKGPATVQAADIICPEEVTIKDPEQVICNLEKGNSLEMDLFVTNGFGYKSALENKKDYALDADTIALDALFTPVRSAQYLSEPARVGQDAKYDKVHIEVEIKMDELDLTAAESKATYEGIKEYVLEHSGLKVSNLYIAQVKQKCGIIERENYNKPKSENARQPKCPSEKEKAIREALKHFGMI